MAGSKYELRDPYSGWREPASATTLAEAKKEAREWLRGGDYPVAETIWVEAQIVHAGTMRIIETVEVEIPPVEPKCSVRTGHEWADNGRRGEGCGVQTFALCRHCGCQMTTIRPYTRPETGEEVFEYVSYSTVEPPRTSAEGRS